MKKKQKPNSFIEALASVKKVGRVGRPTKLQEVERRLGNEFVDFLEACFDDQTTTKAIYRALSALGIKCSYLTACRMRETVESQYGWYVDIVADEDGFAKPLFVDRLNAESNTRK